MIYVHNKVCQQPFPIQSLAIVISVDFVAFPSTDRRSLATLSISTSMNGCLAAAFVIYYSIRV